MCKHAKQIEIDDSDGFDLEPRLVVNKTKTVIFCMKEFKLCEDIDCEHKEDEDDY